jgi:hypothetical protein
MKIDGGCYCGQIRYTFEGDIAAQMQCHCRECQYITGGNPNVFIMVPETTFSYVKGEASSFSRGTAVGTKTPGAPGAMVLKVGTLDDPTIFTPSVAIFTKESQSFHHIPEGVTDFDGLPG